MSNFKFWNFKESSAHIEKLEASIIEKDKEIAVLKENGPAIEAEAKRISEELSTVSEKLKHAESELAAVKQSEAKLTAEKAEADKQLAEANAKIANPPAQVKAAAAVQAAAIVAQAGHQPLGVNPSASQNSGEKVMNRSDFKKLSPQAQMQYAQAGGRLTE